MHEKSRSDEVRIILILTLTPESMVSVTSGSASGGASTDVRLNFRLWSSPLLPYCEGDLKNGSDEVR